LEFKNKFTIENPAKKSHLDGNKFMQWSSSNFYRTSTNDMTNKVSLPIKLEGIS
jgi:hypothetical protein